MKTKFTLLVLVAGACAWQGCAQTLDSGGDGLLSGQYYVRQVYYLYSVSGAVLTETLNVQGTIAFDGAGNYTFNGSVLDSAETPTVKVETFSSVGHYLISGSGEGYISSLEFPGDQVFGTVSKDGIFMGSATQNAYGYNDLFIAVPYGSGATNSTLNGTYTVAYFDPTFPGDAMFSMTADGQGNIGNVNVTAYTGSGSSASTESLSGVTYSFANGAAQLKLGGTRTSSTSTSKANLVAGTELLYVSPDGNFIFGGLYGGYDIFVGVRSTSSPPTNFGGLYYQAGLLLNQGAAAGNYSPLDSYYGSFEALSGKIIGHHRYSNTSPLRYQTLSALLPYGGSSDFNYFDSYNLNSDGSSDDSAFSQHYALSADGTIRIGYGIGPFLSLDVALAAPAYSGSGVYIDPDGVVNAASSAPFTAQVAPGEFLTLYGTGLAPTTASASLPYPKMFNGVQVFVNGVAAPIYYVSPTQISVIVPYITATHEVAQIFVVNNNVSSNLVSQFTGLTSVGAFTYNPEGGLGYAAALHPDNSVISAASPAQSGETVAVYLTGMGAVSLPVSDGEPAPSSPLSVTTSTPLVFLLDSSGNYEQATVKFSGLAPGYAGLYQINFIVPAGLVSGNATLEIIGEDSDNFQAMLPLTTAGSSARAGQ